MKTEFYKARCNCSMKTEVGKYSSNCTLTNMKGESDIFQADFVIIGTDYKNYAIVYRCVKIGTEIIEDNFLVLRPKTAEIKKPEIAKILFEKQKLRLQDFRSRSKRDCKMIRDNMF